MGFFSDSYEKLCKTGRKAAESEDAQKAEDLFLKAIKTDPSQPLAYAYLALLYQKAAGYQSPGEDRNKFGELSVKAFYDAAERETNLVAKAEYCWRRGVTLGLLGRDNERDAAWLEAERIVPDVTQKFSAKFPWLENRTCETCRVTFTLSQHGHPGAWATAEELMGGKGLHGKGDYFALHECPSCKAVTVEKTFREIAAKLKNNEV